MTGFEPEISGLATSLFTSDTLDVWLIYVPRLHKWLQTEILKKFISHFLKDTKIEISLSTTYPLKALQFN